MSEMLPYAKQWRVFADPIAIYEQIQDVLKFHSLSVSPFPEEDHAVISGEIYEQTPFKYPRIGLYLIKKGQPCIVKLSSDIKKATPRSEKDRADTVQSIAKHLDERFEWLNLAAEEVPQARPSKIKPEMLTRPSMRCFKIGVPSCPKKLEANLEQVFIGMPFSPEFEDIYKYGIIPALETVMLRAWKADESITNIDVMCKICEGIQSSRYAIINISGWNPNVLFELGLAYGLSKETVLIKGHEEQVPADLRGMEYIEYRNSDELREKLAKFFQDKGE